MSLIKIDGVGYEVGEVSLSRDFEMIIDNLTQGMTLDNTAIADIMATRINYSMTVDPRTDKAADYDAFVEDITAPKSPRLIEAPYGQGTITFSAIVSAAADDLLRRVPGKTARWGNFTITFQTVKPQRVAV